MALILLCAGLRPSVVYVSPKEFKLFVAYTEASHGLDISCIFLPVFRNAVRGWS